MPGVFFQVAAEFGRRLCLQDGWSRNQWINRGKDTSKMQIWSSNMWDLIMFLAFQWIYWREKHEGFFKYQMQGFGVSVSVPWNQSENEDITHGVMVPTKTQLWWTTSNSSVLVIHGLFFSTTVATANPPSADETTIERLFLGGIVMLHCQRVPMCVVLKMGDAEICGQLEMGFPKEFLDFRSYKMSSLTGCSMGIAMMGQLIIINKHQ